MKKLSIILLLALFAYAAPAPTLNPGVVFQVKTTYHEGSPRVGRVGKMEIKVEKPNLKVSIKKGKGKDYIFRGDRGKNGEMIVVDHDKKTYEVINNVLGLPPKEIPLVDQGGAVDKPVLKTTAGDKPVSETPVIKKVGKKPAIDGTGAKPRTKTVVKTTGERGTKEGYPCVKYEVFRYNKKIREIWTTDWDNIEGGDEAEKAFKAWRAFWDSIPSFPGGDPLDGMNFENGFPVVSSDLDENGDLESEAALRSAKRQTIDPDAFEPPSGYKRMSLGPN